MSLWEQIYAKITDRDTIFFVIGAVLSAFANNVWRRFKKRRKDLRWTVTFNKVSFPPQNILFKPLQVTYDGNPCTTLYTCDVLLSNNSQEDLEDIDFLFWFQNNYVVLQATGSIVGSGKSLMLSPEFSTTMNNVLGMVEADRAASRSYPYVLANREFRVPALNRASSISLQFLIHASHNEQPSIHVSTEYPGVRLTHQKQEPMVLGVALRRAISWGIIVGVILIVLLGPHITTPTGAAAIFFPIGACASLLGVGVVWLGRLIIKGIS
jgi:hypothetical protein